MNNINQQMQALPLETQGPYQSSAQPKPTSDNDVMQLAKVSSQGPLPQSKQNNLNVNRAAMNFETSQKDIFENSGVVTIRSEVQPQDMASDLTLNLNLIQTVASSGLSMASQQNAQELYKDQQKQLFCSLFAIFGLNATEFVHNNFKEQYDVLGSYPNLEKHPEVAAEHKFVQDLRMICFPELSLRTERFKMSNQEPLCRCSFYHFISTNDMGEKKYLTSVHFKEILLSERGAFVIDKSICVASSQPIFSLQKQVLHQIFQKVVLQNNNVSIKAFKQAQWTYDGFLDEFDQPPPQDFPNFVYKFMMDQVMCAENRKIRDRSSLSRSPSPQAKKGGNTAQLPAVDFTSILELYIAIFSKHLYFDPKVERDIHIIQTDGAPAASAYNSNQSLFGTGTNFSTNQQQQQIQQQSQQDQKSNRHVPLFKFRNMKPFGFQLENYPFDLLLQTLKPDKLIQLFTALLLERKIVLIKRDIGDIALIMQSLITLLSPFQWHFTIITYLTRELVDMLDAPFPFIFGVSWATWDSICLTKDYAEEIFIFDLESQERRYITKQEVPELPSPYGEDLLAGLKDVMDKKDRRLAALRAENQHSKSKSLSKRQLDQQFDEQYWADAQLSVKQLFFNFLLLTVNNYIRFYRTDDELNKDNESGGAGGFIGKSSEDFFDFQGYLEWQDERQMEKTGENNLFMREFVKTQAFHEFIEQNSASSENEGAENASVFFESCIELLNDHSLKKLKAAQQEMIDQAKYNLATPVKFKFNGIYSKYVDGLRAREMHLRKCMEELQPEESKQRQFQELSEADQVDDIIMKYIFMRPESIKEFRQYSLIADVNQDMVFERIPKIRYDLVELYWQKMYKTKSGGPGGKQSTRSIENPPQTMQINKPANMQKRKKRLSNKNEIEYDEYINGNQAMHVDGHSETGSQRSNIKNFIRNHTNKLKKNKSGNIIHDYPEHRSQAGSTQQMTTIDQSSGTEIKAKKLERQALSTRNFASLSVQKSQQQRTAYNIKSYHHYTTNKAQNEQLRVGSKAKKSTESFQEALATSQGQQLRLTKSPKMSTLAKSTTMSITRTATTNTLIQQQSFKQGGLQYSYRKTSKASPNNLAAMTAIKSARNKSQQQSNQLQSKQNQKSGGHTTSAKPSTTNFQEKVRVARQRGSIQYIMPETNSYNTSAIQHQVEIIERHEIVNNDELQSLTQRQKQLPQLKHKLTAHLSARHISPHHPQPHDSQSLVFNHKALSKGSKLTNSVQSLGRSAISNRAQQQIVGEIHTNKPIDRQQSFHVKGKQGSQSNTCRDQSKNEAAKMAKPDGTPGQKQGHGSSRQQSMIHPVFNNKTKQHFSQATTPKNYANQPQNTGTGGFSLDTIIPGRKSLKSRQQLKNQLGDPSIELLDPSSSGVADQSNSNISMPVYTEKKAVTNKNAKTATMTHLAHQISVQSNKLNQGLGARNNRRGGAGATLSKVLRISYELPESKNSFINIEKEEEGCIDDGDHTIRQHHESSSLTKDADRTEVQDFTKPIEGIGAQQEIQGGAQQKQQLDSQGSQGGGSILEIEPPAVVKSTDEAEEEKNDDVNKYNSTESFRDGVNEMVEDEAHMAQKTAYYLQYRSKFNKINSDSSIKMPTGTTVNQHVGQPIRKQMMPSNSSLSQVLQRENSKNISNSAFSNIRQSDHSASSASHNQLVMQMSGSSSDNKLSTLLQGKMMSGQIQQSEKQNSRKGPSMPLSMLLTKTNSRPAKRQPGGSKTRSITDKQFSFQEIARLPSQSLVGPTGHKLMTAQQPRIKSGTDLEAPPSMIGVQPKQSQQEEMSIPIPRSSVDNHFHQAALGDKDDALVDDGWFTPIESKRLSHAYPNVPLVSNETKKKLQRFYSDIDGSFMDVSNRLNRNPNQYSNQVQNPNSISRLQQLNKNSTMMQPPQQMIDSPQQSSRKSSSLGKHPAQSISRTTLIENKVLQNQEVAMMSPGQDNRAMQSNNNNNNALATGSVIIDDSIAAPNNGILFSHQKRRTEKYRDD